MPEQKFNTKVSIMKISAKKRVVYGIVYAPETPDAHDHFMKSETIEAMAHRFMETSRQMDEQHDFIKGAGQPVESFIVREGDKDFVDKSGQAMIGAWVLGTKVYDDNVWKKIQKGEIKAYSLAGMADIGKEQEMDSDWVDDNGNRINPYNS